MSDRFTSYEDVLAAARIKREEAEFAAEEESRAEEDRQAADTTARLRALQVQWVADFGDDIFSALGAEVRNGSARRPTVVAFQIEGQEATMGRTQGDIPEGSAPERYDELFWDIQCGSVWAVASSHDPEELRPWLLGRIGAIDASIHDY
jgi:hypothetical protein